MPRYRPPENGAERAEASRLRAGVTALIVAMKPGNAGGAKGCREVETWCPNAVERHRRKCLRRLTTPERIHGRRGLPGPAQAGSP
jgi:hypothetical protein